MNGHGRRYDAVVVGSGPNGLVAANHLVDVDRMQDRIEALAPGFSSRILARRVLGPRELESRNAARAALAHARLARLSGLRPRPRPRPRLQEHR